MSLQKPKHRIRYKQQSAPKSPPEQVFVPGSSTASPNAGPSTLSSLPGPITTLTPVQHPSQPFHKQYKQVHNPFLNPATSQPSTASFANHKQPNLVEQSPQQQDKETIQEQIVTIPVRSIFSNLENFDKQKQQQQRHHHQQHNLHYQNSLTQIPSSNQVQHPTLHKHHHQHLSKYPTKSFG